MNITLFAGNFPPFPLKPDRNIYEWTVNLDFLRCQATIKWKEWITSATFEDIEVWWRHCWVCSNLFEPRWPVFIYTGCDPLPCPSVACIKLFKQPDKSTAGRSHWGKQSGEEEGGKHYTITLTCSTAMVTYLMNKSHYQGPDNSDTEPLLLWQMSASLSIFLSLCYLFFFYFSAFSPSTIVVPTSLARAGWPTVLTLFITRLWHFWIKLHTRTDWTLLVRAGKHRSFPFGFQ